MSAEEHKRHQFARLDMAVYSDSRSDVIGWLDEAMSFWSSIITDLNGSSSVAKVEGVESEVVEHLQSLQEKRDDLSHQPLTAKQMAYEIKDLINRDDLPFFDDALSRVLLSSVKSKADLYSAVMIYRSYKYARFAALESFEGVWEKGLRDEIDGVKKRTYKDLNDFNSAITESAKNHLVELGVAADKRMVAIEELARDTSEKAKDSIEVLANKINANLVSSKPVAFWEKKIRHHKIRSAIFALVSVLLVVASVSLIGVLLYFTQMSNTDKLAEWVGFPIPDHYPIALTILVGTAAVWVAKITLKLMMTNLSLESEAYAKATTIQTYVALSHTALSAETVNEFHKSLLNSTSGDFSGDIATPELVKIIEVLMKKPK